MTELLVCDECVRSLALAGPREGLGLDTSVNLVSRHPEAITDTVCALCQRGPGVHPAADFVRLVLERRPGASFAEERRQWQQMEDDR